MSVVLALLDLAAEILDGLEVLSCLLGVVEVLFVPLRQLEGNDFSVVVTGVVSPRMGVIVLGLFSLQATAIHGALLQMLSHGVAVAGLFALLGMLEQRLGPAYLQATALSTVAPRFAVWLMLFVLTTVALPLTSGFTAEFLILFGAFTQGLVSWRRRRAPTWP